MPETVILKWTGFVPTFSNCKREDGLSEADTLASKIKLLAAYDIFSASAVDSLLLALGLKTETYAPRRFNGKDITTDTIAEVEDEEYLDLLEEVNAPLFRYKHIPPVASEFRKERDWDYLIDRKEHKERLKITAAKRRGMAREAFVIED
jgi:hypothetical protein